MPPKLIIEILGDDSGLEKTLRRDSRGVQQFGKTVERAGRGAVLASIGFKGMHRYVASASAAFLGGAGLISVLKSSVSAASSLNEQTSKTNIVFGENAKQIKRWSNTTATSMGLAKDEALETASSFGALFKPVGILGDEAAKQSVKLTKLGADLASFYDTSVADALAAIRSGLVGEAEPLRRYGALLSETRVQQEAMNETGKSTATQLTQQDKVLARLALIYKDTAVAQGNFAKTSGGLANQTRTLQANVRNLEISIGKALIPVVTKLTTKLNKWLGNSENNKRVTQDLTTFVEDLGSAASTAADGVVKLADAFDYLRDKRNSLKNFKGKGPSGIDIIKGADKFFGASEAVKGILGDLGLRDDSKKPSAATSGRPPRSNFFFGHVPGVVSSNATSGSGSAGRRPTGLGTLSAAQRNQLALAKAVTPGQQLVALGEQRRILAGQIASVTKQLAGASGRKAKNLADKLIGLTSDDTAALQQITSINEAAAADQQRIVDEQRRKTEEAARKAKAAEAKRQRALAAFFKSSRSFIGSALGPRAGETNQGLSLAQGQRKFQQAARARELQQRQRQQFLHLGLTAEGGQRAPGLKSLVAETNQVSKALKGTLLDTDKNRNLIAQVRKVLAGQFGKLTDETKRSVKDLLDALKPAQSDALPSRFKHVSPNKLARELGFVGPDSIRRAAAVLSQIGYGGTAPAGSAAFAGGGVHFNGPTTIHVSSDDTGKLEAQLTKRARSRPQVRRGAR